MNSTVKDVMSRSVVAVRETAGYKDIVAVMRRRRVSAFPVLDSGGHVVGVVSEADLLLKEVIPAAGRLAALPWAPGRGKERVKAMGVTAADLMSKPAITIGPDATVAAAARLMYTRRVKRLPVVDGDGCLTGVVSRVDLLSVFGRPGEQIRDEVIKEILGGDFALDPADYDVQVKSGIVTMAGPAPSPRVATALIEAVRHVEGVVDVRDRLSYPPEMPKITGIT
jgi:CBS domain-containing protein